MFSFFKKFITAVAVICIVAGCTHSQESFRTKIRSMSDLELTGCYDGLNDRIKALENNEKLNRRPDETEVETMMAQSTFFFKGEGQDLVQKQKQVRKEMVRRNILPE